MKPLRLVPLAGLGALAVMGAPGASQPPAEQVGAFELQALSRGHCSVDRAYAGGTSFFLSGSADGSRTIIVHNRLWPMPPAGPYKLVLRRGAERIELEAEDKLGASPNGLMLRLAAPMAARVASARSIEVVRPDGSVVESLDLDGIGAAAERMLDCIARSAEYSSWPAPPAPPAPPPPPSNRRGKAQPARAKANLVSLFSDEDYPVAAIRAGEHGIVAFRLQINEIGRVSECAVTSSSGSATLDSTTCRLLTARARFTPALDRKGRPTTDSATGRIRWVLPEPEPEPKLPPPPSP